MNMIENKSFEGERSLFGIHDTKLVNVDFFPGESPVKEAKNIAAVHCKFMGKYPFWHNQYLRIEECEFTINGRAAIWYSDHVVMKNCLVFAPKMFREVTNLNVENTDFPYGEEFLWNCSSVTLNNVSVQNGDYILMNGRNIQIDNFKLQGNYSFQGAQDVVIKNSHIDSKDAFWNSHNVTVYDSVLNGEYLGWHSTNLRLVNCTISGTQPLCYATNLVMENCIMQDADLCFEYSSLNADIQSDVISIKNPASGVIKVKRVGEVIIDDFCHSPGEFKIVEIAG